MSFLSTGRVRRDTWFVPAMLGSWVCGIVVGVTEAAAKTRRRGAAERSQFLIPRKKGSTTLYAEWHYHRIRRLSDPFIAAVALGGASCGGQLLWWHFGGEGIPRFGSRITPIAAVLMSSSFTKTPMEDVFGPSLLRGHDQVATADALCDVDCVGIYFSGERPSTQR